MGDFRRRAISRILRGCHFLSDESFLRLKYRLMFGKKLDLKNPKTFNEKLQWLKLYDRNNKYTTMVDKYEAKKYVADIIGDEYIIPTIGIYDSFEEIDFNKLPNQFVIKCTHDSGGLVVVKDKSKLDIIAAKNKINGSLKRNFYYNHREWPYKNIKPRIIVEEYMEDRVNGELIDYKVMCFNGVAKIIFTCTERFSNGLKVTFFDLDWNKLQFTRHYPSSKKKINKPKNFKKMIKFSEMISKEITFIRMDWYEINGRLYFSECTFYPGSGFEEFEPEIWDKRLGDWMKLRRRGDNDGN